MLTNLEDHVVLEVLPFIVAAGVMGGGFSFAETGNGSRPGHRSQERSGEHSFALVHSVLRVED